MEPEINDGALCLVDKTKPCRPGDLVVLYIAPEHRQPGVFEGVLKRLVMAPPPWVTFPWQERAQGTFGKIEREPVPEAFRSLLGRLEAAEAHKHKRH